MSRQIQESTVIGLAATIVDELHADEPMTPEQRAFLVASWVSHLTSNITVLAARLPKPEQIMLDIHADLQGIPTPDNCSIEEQRALNASVKAHGVLIPLAARRGQRGYTVDDGGCRVQAALANGIRSVPAFVVDAYPSAPGGKTIARIRDALAARAGGG